MALDDRLLQVANAAGRRVLGKVLLEGSHGGLFDVLRSGEVGLSGAEVHHVHSARFELIGFGDHRRR